jgi:hypothetical protein
VPPNTASDAESLFFRVRRGEKDVWEKKMGMEGAYNRFGNRYWRRSFIDYLFQIIAHIALDVRWSIDLRLHYLVNLEMVELINDSKNRKSRFL